MKSLARPRRKPTWYSHLFSACLEICEPRHTGHFAVKKIAVGESHSYLYRTLREVSVFNVFVYASFCCLQRVLGPSFGDTATSQYRHIPSCMARIMPVFDVRPQSSNAIVRIYLSSLQIPLDSGTAVSSCNGPKVEGM